MMNKMETNLEQLHTKLVWSCNHKTWRQNRVV